MPLLVNFTLASPSTSCRTCFALFTRHTVLSDLPFIQNFQICLARISGPMTIISGGRHAGQDTPRSVVFLQRNDLYCGKRFSGKADGVVGRTVIYKDDFAIGIGLVTKSAETVFEKSLAIPFSNDNADFVVFVSRFPFAKITHLRLYVSYLTTRRFPPRRGGAVAIKTRNIIPSPT
jgi:hypothetical protein